VEGLTNSFTARGVLRVSALAFHAPPGGVFSEFEMQLQPHPAAERWPMLDKKRHQELVEDIKQNGQRESIALCDGMILDGRNRYKACCELGLIPKTKEFTGNPWAYSWSLNGARRDVSDLQRAAIKYQLDQDSDEWQAKQEASRKDIHDEANRKRRDAAGGNKNAAKDRPKTVGVPKEHTLKPEAKRSHERPGRSERAKAANVSPSTQAKVEWIANKDRALLDKVAKGEIKGSHAIKSIKADERKKVVEQVEAATANKKKKVVSSGDIWQLGTHTLFVGDTSSDEFRRIVPQSALAFADPPYGAGKQGYDDSVFYWKHDFLLDKSDVVVVTPGIVSIFEFARITKMPYVWSIACWLSNGMTRGAIGFGNWIYGAVFSHGSVFRQKQDFCKVAISIGETDETTHTTRKPSEFMAYVIETFSDKADTVVDPFLGSGQTLLTCEKMGRRCFGGEIDPKFCENIIARWEAMTGREARKNE
jgi:hypothetical protein